MADSADSRFLDIPEGHFHVKIHHAKLVDAAAVVVKNNETKEKWETVLHSMPSARAIYKALVKFSDFSSSEKFKKVKWERERGRSSLSKK